MVTDTYTYTAFGELLDHTGTTVNPYLYTGQQFDMLTGLYNLRARHYDPTVGRFLTRDAFPYNLQDPIELVRYIYAAGDPINHIDPTGSQSLLSYALLNIRSYIAVAGARIAVGGTVGAVLGGVLGGCISYGMYMRSISGDCGVDRQTQAQFISEGDTFRSGFVLGAITGGLIGAGYAAGTLTAYIASFALIGIGGRGAWLDLREIAGDDLRLFSEDDELNICTVSSLVLNVSAIISGIYGIRATSRGAFEVQVDPAKVLQNLVDRADARLRANPELARQYLTSRQYARAQVEPWFARRMYGVAIENMVKENISNSRSLSVLRLKNWTLFGPFIREGSAGPTPPPQIRPG